MMAMTAISMGDHQWLGRGYVDILVVLVVDTATAVDNVDNKAWENSLTIGAIEPVQISFKGISSSCRIISDFAT